jgi:hypothetical protein
MWNVHSYHHEMFSHFLSFDLLNFFQKCLKQVSLYVRMLCVVFIGLCKVVIMNTAVSVSLQLASLMPRL